MGPNPSFRSSAAYRIALSYAAVLAWTVLLLGTVIYLVADNEFRLERDREIAGELDRLSREPSRSDLVRELHWRMETVPANRFRYALFDRGGDKIAGALDIAPPAPGFVTLPLPDRNGQGRSARAGTVELADASRLVVAADMEAVDRIDRAILKFFAAGFLAVLTISAIGGLLLHWYLRNRLKPIRASADAIVTADIEWRVPVSGHGDEFDSAGRAVNLMLDRIARLMVNLRQVSSDIAHDLRKPLMRLLLQTDRLGKVEGAEQRVFELGDEMLALFSGILRIAEVESGGLERGFARVDFSSLMAEVAESYAPALDDAEDTIDWTIDPGVVVMGNRELLAQLAANLLDNARIHTPPGTAIKLGLFKNGANARFSVEDNGPGVSEADRDKLLQRFYRAETSRTTPGNGLGLSLVAAVARAHRGSVAIEDAEPGLRVVVTVPRLND